MPPQTPPQKLAFNEVVTSSTIFYNNPSVESEFNVFIEEKAQQIRDSNIGHGHITRDDILHFLLNETEALGRILGILHLSEEKFLRIISLIRRLQGTYDKEWSIDRIEKEIRSKRERFSGFFADTRLLHTTIFRIYFIRL